MDSRSKSIAALLHAVCIILCPNALSAQAWHDTIPMYQCKEVAELTSQTLVQLLPNGKFWFQNDDGIGFFDGTPYAMANFHTGLPSNAANVLIDEKSSTWYLCTNISSSPIRAGYFEHGRPRAIALPDSFNHILQRADGKIFFLKNENGIKSDLFARNEQDGSFAKVYKLPTAPNWAVIDMVSSLSEPSTLIVSLFSPQKNMPSRFFRAYPDQRTEEFWLPLSPNERMNVRIMDQAIDGSFLCVWPDANKVMAIKGAQKQILRQNETSNLSYLHSPTPNPYAKTCFFERLTNTKPFKKYCLWQFEKGAIRPFGFNTSLARSHVPDAQGQYWLSGTNHISRLNPHIRVFEPDEKTPSNIWSVVEDGKGMYYFGGYGDGLVRFDGKRMLPAPPKLQSYHHWMHGPLRIGNEVWMPMEGTLGMAVCNTDGRCDTILKGEIAFIVHQGQKDGSILLGLYNKGMMRCPAGRNPRERKNWHLIGEKQGWKLTNTLGITQDNAGMIWGCRNSTGLAKYDPVMDTAHTWPIRDIKKDYGGMCLLTDSRGNIWFGTIHGLRFFHPEKPGFRPERDLKPVAEAFFHKKTIATMALYGRDSLLVFDRENRFVLVDLKKFYAQNEDEKGCLTYFPEIRDVEGVVGQNGCLVDSKREVWLPMQKKLIQFRLQDLVPADDTKAKITLDSLSFSGGSIQIGDLTTANLPKGIRTCVFHFAPDFYYPGLYDTIRLTIDTVQVFDGLPNEFRQVRFTFANGGQHKIRLVTIRNQTILYEKNLVLYVPYLFAEHPAFWPFVILAFGLLSSLVLYNRKKHYKQLNNETTARLALTEENRSILEMLNGQQTLLARLRINALANQLNPHFLKNALNLIQTKVLDDHPEVADVINRLAQSLTIVVESSNNVGLAMNTLANELRLAENYLYIQKGLFPDRLQFEIKGRELLDTYGSLSVPLMSVQIFVENAMFHGIENKIEGGTIVISLRELDQSIEVEVDDDGVGFEEAARIAADKNRKSTGRGMEMIKQLFEILNQKHKSLLFYKISHKAHPDGSAAGVKILISFPKAFKYETK